MTEIIAIEAKIFADLEHYVKGSIRRRFDDEQDWTTRMNIIDEAKGLRLPDAFINELESDLKAEAGLLVQDHTMKNDQ